MTGRHLINHARFSTNAFISLTLFFFQPLGQNAAHAVPDQGLSAHTGYLQVRPAVSAAPGVSIRL